MTIEEWGAVAETLKRYGRVYYIPYVSEREICAFEARMGFRLPALYREWLQFSDGGMLLPPAGLQLYGVSHKPLIEADTPGLPDGYVAIGAMPYGDPVVFQPNGEAIMIFRRARRTVEGREFFADFQQFLERLPELLGLEA